MAERFNLTAQLQLQAPTNTGNVANQIRRDLGNINVNVDVKANNRSMSGINNSLQSIRSNAAGASKGISTLNRNLAESARRFSVITVATGTFIAFARSIKNSIGNAIEFEREMVKISQVTGRSVTQLQGLSNEVTRISKNFGVANQSLLETARVLTQAGLNAKKTKEALQVLANTTLAPTFDNIRDTAEGAIAILNQFGREAAKVGQDIKFLEQSLDAINAVSKRFAVESSDLITAVRRTGGVFEAAGGSLNELVALFTSVRATTRESAETIATGFRTIFTRIQRTETIDQLKQLGIELTDLEGKFIGPMKAIEALSVGLAGLDPRDTRFNEIVEQLGGFRQIGKVIPLLKQFATAQNALSVANSATGSTARDALIAQQALSVQFQKVKEQFDALVRTLAGSDTFRGLATTAIELASAFLKFAESLERVLPQLTTLAALKIGRNIAPGLLALAGGARGRATGGPVSRFASGGMVPGTGNRDTVPAMLTPGEFVIRKSSVKKLGADKLQAMNNNRYASGGMAKIAKIDKRTISLDDGDTFSARATPATDKFEATFRTMGYDAYETGNKDSRVSPQKYKEIQKYNEKNKKFQQAKQKGSGGGAGFKVPSNTIVDGRGTTATRAADLATDALKGILAKKKNLQELVTKQDGGFGRYGINVGTLRPGLTTGRYQKFSLGGIANVSRVGAAILEEDQGAKNQQFRVGVKDVQKAVGGGSGSAGSKLRAGVGAQFKGKQYTLVAQGLGQKTSEGFREALIDGVAVGLDSATGSLGADLGLGQATLDPASRNEFKSYVGKRPMVGDLFEAALSSLSGKGVFKEAQVSAPFDFPGGLSGTIADNYNKLPSSWVDARSSFAQATASAFKTKVANELGDEYKRQFASGNVKEAAKGGSASGTDTVPALLTPGEFVFSKSAAQRIGYANLDRMNKKGVTGYASGGPVMLGKGGDGGLRGGTGSRTFGDSFGSFGELISATVIKEVEKALQFVSDKMMEAGNAISNLDKVSGKLVKVMSTLSAKLEEQSKTTQQSNNKDKADLNAETKEASTKGGGEKSSGGRSLAQMGQLNKNIIANGNTLSEIDANTHLTNDLLKSVNRKLGRLESSIKASFVGVASEEGIVDAELVSSAANTADDINQLAQIICECIEQLKGERQNQQQDRQQEQQESGTRSSRRQGGGLGQKLQGVGPAIAKGLAAPLKAVSGVIGTFSGALQRVSSGLIALSFISGTIVQQMGNLSEAQKEQIQAGLNSVSVFAAIGAEVISFGLGIVSAGVSAAAFGVMLAGQAAAGAVGIAMRIKEAAVSAITTVANLGLAGAATAAGAALTSSTVMFTVALLPVITALGLLATGAAMAAVAVSGMDEQLYEGIGSSISGVAQLGASAFTTARKMEALKQSTEKFEKAADKLLDRAGTGEARQGDREAFIALRRQAAEANFQRGAIGAKQFSIPGLQTGGADDPYGFKRLGDSIMGRSFGRGQTNFGRQMDLSRESAEEIGRNVGNKLAENNEDGMISSIFKRFVSAGSQLATGVQAPEALSELTANATQFGLALKETLNPLNLLAEGDAIINEFLGEIDHFTNRVGDISERLSAVTYDATIAVQTFQQALERADTEGLSAEQRLDVRSSGALALAKEGQIFADEVKRTGKTLRVLEERLADTGLVAGGERTEKSIDDRIKEEQAMGRLGDDDQEVAARRRELEIEINQRVVLEKQFNEALDAANRVRETSFQQEAQLRQDLITVSGERIEALRKSGNLLGISNLQDLQTQLGPGQQAAESRLQSLINIRGEDRTRDLDPEKDKKLIENITAQTKNSLDNLIPTVRKLQAEQLLAANRIEAASIIQRLAMIANKRAMDDVTNSFKALNNFILGASKSADILSNIDDEIAQASGGTGATRKIDTRAFDIPLEELGAEAFEQMLTRGMKATTPTGLAAPLQQAAEDQVQRMADQLRTAKFLTDGLEDFKFDLGKGVTDLLSIRLDTVEGKTSQNQIDAIMAQIVKQIGDANFKTGNLEAPIRAFLDEAFEDARFDENELAEFNKMLNENTKGIREAQKKYAEQINEFITAMDKLNDAVDKAEQRFNEASANVEEVRERALNREAEYTGQARNRDEMERGRRRAANQRLGADARAFGARAGNVGATAGAARKARAEADALIETNKKLAKSGDVNTDAYRRNAERIKVLNRIYQNSSAELKRMTDQSARASEAMAKVGDLEEKLEKLKAAFDQTKGFLQDFAFATNEQRGEVLKGFQDLGNAMRQGSLRGATGEQRQRIGGILDQLSDVTFATGETGAQMKGRFATQELIDLGFDPQFAAIAGQEFAKGPIQKQMLDEIKRIGAQEIAAAEAIRDLEAQNLQATEDLRTELGDNFSNDLSQAIGDLTSQLKADTDATNKEEERLKQELEDAKKNIGTYTSAIAEYTTKIENFTAQLTQLLKEESAIQKQGGIAEEVSAPDEQAKTEAKAKEQERTFSRLEETLKSERKANQKQLEKIRQAEEKRAGLTIDTATGPVTKGGIVLDPKEAEGEVAGLRKRLEPEIDKMKDFIASSFAAELDLDESIFNDMDLDAVTKNYLDQVEAGILAFAKNPPEGQDGQSYAVVIRQFEKNVLKNVIGKLEDYIKKELKIGGGKGLAGGEAKGNARGGRVGYFNRGGIAAFEPKGTDTIPAMLSPGEYVINAKAAKKIGYGKLNQMNYMQRGGRAGGANNQMDPMFAMAMRLQQMGLPVGPQSKGGIDPRTFFTKGDKELIKQFGVYSEQQVREINRLGYFTQEQSDMLRKAGFNPENIVLDPETQKIFESFGKQISPELVKALTTGTLGQDPGKNLFDPKSITNPLQGPLQQSANAAGQSSKLLLDLIQCVCGETELTKSILDEQKKQTQQKASDAFKSAWESVKKGFGGLFEGMFGGGSGSSSGGGAGPTKGLFGMRGARFVNRAKYGLGTGSRDSRAVRARRLGQGTPRYLQFPFGSGARQGMFMPGGGGGFGGGAAGGATGGGKSVMQNFKDAIKSFQSGVSALAAGGGRSSRDSLLSVMQDIRQLIAKLVECTCGVMIDFSSVSSVGAGAGGAGAGGGVFDFFNKIPSVISGFIGNFGSAIEEGASTVSGFGSTVSDFISGFISSKDFNPVDALAGLFGREPKKEQEASPLAGFNPVDALASLFGRDPKTEQKARKAETRRSPGDEVFGDMTPEEMQSKPTGDEDISYSREDLKNATIATIASTELKPNMLGPGPQDDPVLTGSDLDSKDLASVETVKRNQRADAKLAEQLKPPSKASFRMQELEKVREAEKTGQIYVSSAVSQDEINKVKGMSDEEFNRYRQDPQKAYEDQLQANKDARIAYDKRDMTDTSGLFAGQTEEEKDALRRAGTGVKSQAQLDSQMQGFIDATKAATDAYNNDPRVKAGTKASEMSKQDRQEVAAKRKAMKAAEAQEKAEASRLRKENQKAMEFDDPQANALRRGRAMAGTKLYDDKGKLLTDPLDKHMRAKDDTEARQAKRGNILGTAMIGAGMVGGGKLIDTTKYDETGALKDTHTQDQVRELRRMDSNMRTSATRFLQTGDGVKSTKFDRDDKKPKTKGKQGDSGFMGMIRGAGSFLGRLMGGPVEGRRSSAEVRKMKIAQAARAGGPNRMMQMQLTKQDSVLSVLQDIRSILAQCCGVSGGGGMGGGMFGGGGGVVAQQFPTGPPQTDPRYAPDQYQYGMSSFAMPSQIPNAPPMGGGGMFGPAPNQQGGVFGGTPEMGMQMDLTGITGPICDCIKNMSTGLGGVLELIRGDFAAIMEGMGEVANATQTMPGSMDFNHTFSGELTVAVKMPDGAAQQIQEVLGKSLQTYLEDKVPEWVQSIKDQILDGPA